METKNEDSPIGKARGQLTARMAREISPYWEERGYYVLYDHDPSSKIVGKIVSSFGEQPPKRSTQLSHIDIAQSGLSGMIAGVHNDMYREGNRPYGDMDRDWDADA